MHILLQTAQESKRETGLIKAVRGAITVEQNSPQHISDAVITLLNEIIDKNKIKLKDVVSCVFTMTKDLNAAYPAKFAREKLNFINIPMMCYQELDIEDSLKMCLRVLLTVYTEKQENIKHIYLNGAQALRPDL